MVWFLAPVQGIVEHKTGVRVLDRAMSWLLHSTHRVCWEEETRLQAFPSAGVTHWAGVRGPWPYLFDGGWWEPGAMPAPPTLQMHSHIALFFSQRPSWNQCNIHGSQDFPSCGFLAYRGQRGPPEDAEVQGNLGFFQLGKPQGF